MQTIECIHSACMYMYYEPRNGVRAVEALTQTLRVSSGYTAFASKALLALASTAVHVQLGHN